MQSVIQAIESKYKKPQVVDVRTGDSVKVHQKIKEGAKERVEVFEGLVIRTDRKNSLTSSITVRRLASGIGVEKSFIIHSPNVLKVEVTKRSKVRRNYLSYMRVRTGKSARLTSVDFDKRAVNTIHDAQAEAAEAKIHAEAEADHEAAAQAEAAEATAETKKFEEVAKDRAND